MYMIKRGRYPKNKLEFRQFLKQKLSVRYWVQQYYAGMEYLP